MLEEIVESTNAHLHATLGKGTPPRGYPAGRRVATSLGESLEGPLVGGDQEVPWGAVRPRRGEEHAHVHQRHVV